MPLSKFMKFGGLQTMIPFLPRNFYRLTPDRRFQVNPMLRPGCLLGVDKGPSSSRPGSRPRPLLTKLRAKTLL